jgi:hypothetical protein
MITTIKEWKQFKLNETVNDKIKIDDKDWDRMSTLFLSGNNGEKIVNSIKDKNKAIVRFIVGVKLTGKKLNFIETGNKQKYTENIFSSFGNKALELGATTNEIQIAFDNITIPEIYINKLNKSTDKKLDNKFVGFLSKLVLDAGYNIEYLNGNRAITYNGKDAMSRSGRKWTIGYKTIIDLGEKKINFDFDAVTDEGDGPTYYVLMSDQYQNINKTKFIEIIKNILSQA